MTVSTVTFSITGPAATVVAALRTEQLLQGHPDSKPLLDTALRPSTPTLGHALDKHSRETGVRSGNHRLLGCSTTAHRLCPLPGRTVPMRLNDPSLQGARMPKAVFNRQPRAVGQLSMEQSCIAIILRDYDLDVPRLRLHPAWRFALTGKPG